MLTVDGHSRVHANTKGSAAMKNRSQDSNGPRRIFLRDAAVGVGAMLLPGVASAASLAFQPGTFEVTSDSATVWARGDGAARVVIEISADEKITAPRRSEPVALDAARGFAAAVRIGGLEPDQVWYYRVVDAQSGSPLARTGRFRTAPTAPRPFAFAWTADMDEAYKPFRLFDAIGARNPEFFLHLGDSIYADLPRKTFNPSVAHYRRKHATNRADTHLQQFLLRHPTYAMWDDHETDNNVHGGHPNMGEAMQVFREYWPCNPAGPDGLYRRFSWAGVDFLMLDTRRFRSPQADAEGPAKTMLGAAQKQWLLGALESSKAAFKFIITSVPFQGGGQDTWGNYRTERNEISAFIRERNVGGVVFLTGDYHLARDWSNPKAGFREFMAGPIATFVHYSRNEEARARYEKSGTFHYGDGYNFGLVRVDPVARKAEIEYVDVEGKTLKVIEFSA